MQAEIQRLELAARKSTSVIRRSSGILCGRTVVATANDHGVVTWTVDGKPVAQAELIGAITALN
jgi:hypothetical protein